MQQSKIDAIVNKMIDNISHTGRGFVLDLAGDARRKIDAAAACIQKFQEDKAADGSPQMDRLDSVWESLTEASDSLANTTIEVRESLPPVDEYEPPAAARNHQIASTQSFCDFCLRYGTPTRSLVLCGDTAAMLVIDELVDRGQREFAWMAWTPSDDWKAWTSALGRGMTHRELLKFLGGQEHNLNDPSLLLPLRSLKLTSQIDMDSDIQDNGETLGVVFKTNGGESLAKFKKRIRVHVPVLDQDVLLDSEQWSEAEIRLDVELPREAGKQPLFVLQCSTWRQIRKQRIDAETGVIRQALGEGWLVLLGEHVTEPRRIGRGGASGASGGKKPF